MAATPPDPDDLTADSIAVAAQQPQSGSVDGVQAAAHSLPDMITARRFAATEAALPASGGSAWGGPVRIARAQPPGTTG